MTEVSGYQCDYCNKVYSDKEETKKCEDSHVKHHQIVVTGCYDYGSRYMTRIPRRIVTRFSDNHGDFASYSLEHYGFKGV